MFKRRGDSTPPNAKIILGVADFLGVTTDEIFGKPKLEPVHTDPHIKRTVENMQLIEQETVRRDIADTAQALSCITGAKQPEIAHMVAVLATNAQGVQRLEEAADMGKKSAS